jgi:hypothetical protein
LNRSIVGYLIGLAFAVYWLWVGAGAVGGVDGKVIFAGGSLVLLAILWRIWSRRKQWTTAGRFRVAWYLAAVAGEIIAMNLALLILPKSFFAGYQAPIIGTIVGVHFVGLWMATSARRFLYLSGGMTALNLLAFVIPPGHGPAILSGLGSSAAIAIAVAA